MSNPVSDTEKTKPQGRNYLREFVAMVKGIRFSVVLVAFCLAVTLWYTVTVRDKVESWVDVQVVFKGTPDNLTITNGLINKLAVRVCAARGLSRGLVGRDATVVVDISSITRGSNTIAVTREMLPFNSAYEVIEVSPSRIVIEADTIATREIGIESWFEGKLAPDMFVKSLSLTPQKVSVRGGEKLVTGISRIRIPIPLSADVPAGTSKQTVAVPAPVNVAVTPPQVEVKLEIGIRTRQMRFTRSVVPLAYADGHKPTIAPGKVVIVAEIPESAAKDDKQLEQVIASVALPPDIRVEGRVLPVAVSLPPNATVVSVTPFEVTVKIEN
jgi:YbbR domain-containing protein